MGGWGVPSPAVVSSSGQPIIDLRIEQITREILDLKAQLAQTKLDLTLEGAESSSQQAKRVAALEGQTVALINTLNTGLRSQLDTVKLSLSRSLEDEKAHLEGRIMVSQAYILENLWTALWSGCKVSAGRRWQAFIRKLGFRRGRP